MKPIIIIVLISLLLFTTCIENEKEPVFDVLVIGSSYTGGYCSYLDDITFISNDSINMYISSLGNGTLKRHLNEGRTIPYISENHLDYVMIQEAAFMASLEPEKMPEATVPYLKTLIDTIRYFSPNARIGLYMSHAYKTGNTDRCEIDSVVCTYEGMQNRIIENYNNLANTFKLEIAPVGYYWQKFYNEHPDLELWQSDNSHGSIEGNYFTACIIFSTIYRRKPNIFYPPHADSLEIQTIHDFIVNIDFESKEWE